MYMYMHVAIIHVYVHARTFSTKCSDYTCVHVHFLFVGFQVINAYILIQNVDGVSPPPSKYIILTAIVDCCCIIIFSIIMYKNNLCTSHWVLMRTFLQMWLPVCLELVVTTTANSSCTIAQPL